MKTDSPGLSLCPGVSTSAEGNCRDRKTTRVLFSGNSQAVRIPREFHVEGDEIELEHKGATLVRRPKKKSWSLLADSLGKFPKGFMEKGRKQPVAQKRTRPFS